MSTQKDLMGLGTPAEAALRLGWPAIEGVSAAGTTAADATVLKKGQRLVFMTATGADGLKLPADAELMVPYIIHNTSGSTGLIYPPTDGRINSGTATTGTLSMATLKTAIFWRGSPTHWVAILTA